MRLRIFDWATRKFWVVALWEDRTLRVSFYGPAHDTWFHCWKWEPKPPNSDPYRYEISFMTAGGRVADPPRQDALEAWFKSLEEMQCENMEAALNSPWLGKSNNP